MLKAVYFLRQLRQGNKRLSQFNFFNSDCTDTTHDCYEPVNLALLGPPLLEICAKGPYLGHTGLESKWPCSGLWLQL